MDQKQVNGKELKNYGKIIGKELHLPEGIYVKYPPAINESYITDGAKHVNANS